MDIILYKCTDEINSFPKTLTEGVTISGTLRGECDMLYPVLTFSGENGLRWFKEYNYIHIPDFNRYYFVSSLNLTSNASIEISCSVDVLQSWKDYILNMEAVVERNEFQKNPYIIDTKPIYMPTNTEIKIPADKSFNILTNAKENSGSYFNYVVFAAASPLPE